MAFRKKQPISQIGGGAIATGLRQVVKQLNKGEFDSALSMLDELSATPALSDDRKCQIASLAGQALLLQGKFAQASDTFQKAWQIGSGTSTNWFKAALGRVTAQLRNADIDGASKTAIRALNQAKQAYQQYNTQLGTASQTFAQSGSIQIAPTPILPSTVAFRIGQQFWIEGETDRAAGFYAESLKLDPKGAFSARIAQARIALVNEDYETAYSGALDALTVGKFSAQTLSAWPVLIAAAQKLGRSGIGKPLIDGLSQAVPSVRGRAKLLIVQTLRAYNNSSWIELATIQAGEDPYYILQAQFGKMKLASNSSDINAAADLINTPNLGPMEWLGAAKAVVIQKLVGNGSPETDSLLAEGVSRHGASWRHIFLHGLARACVQAKRPDLAINLIESDPQTLSDNKSLWLLASLQRSQGNISVAASLFEKLSALKNIPPRFQVLATIEWMRCIIQLDDTEALDAAAPQLLATANQIQDYELLLDLARQMSQAPSQAADLAPQVFERGENLAVNLLASEENPTAALQILFKLSRRQSDFGKDKSIIKQWEQLTAYQRNWLWTKAGVFWQYLSLVFDAYRHVGNFTQADSLAQQYLNDSATPPNGVAEIGIPQALSLIERNKTADAFKWFEWIVGQAPTYSACAYAYYWLALRSVQGNDRPKVQSNVQSLRLALGSSLGMHWKQELDVRCRLLSGIPVAQIAAETTYSIDFLQSQSSEIQQDQAKL
ncbi:MAG: hypothetical protein PHC88_01120 [Terrimicrobiaceae bacterium]|nr:hypothetical protein [Terrimicrobiaceae bacterium]